MEIILIIAAAIILLLLVWYISVSNKLNKLLIKIEEADSGIDVALTKRYDVLTKLIDIVKAYAKHEKETLQSVIAARNSAMSATSVQEKAQAETELNKTLKTSFKITNFR